MASLSSKRKSSANRRMQGRDRRVDAPKVSIRQTVPTTVIFDEVTYTSARSRFEAALGSAVTGEQDVAQVMRVLIQQEFDQGGRDAALKMQPYIVKFVGEYRDAQLKSLSTAGQ